MRRILVLAAVAATLLLPSTAQAHTVLPKGLPAVPACSRLQHLEGKAKWRHVIYHLRRSEYRRICATIEGESHWQPSAENSAGYAGLMQFGTNWYAGVQPPKGSGWHWNPHNPVLSIRVMVYVLRHPQRWGGWSNWAGH
jgi:soluble lytic murein transglycosylase-like protein